MIVSTNIRLPKEQWQALKLKAVMEGTSASALVRKAIDQLIRTGTQVSGRLSRKKRRDPFFAAIGLGSGGPADDSTAHDRYLYRHK